MCYWRVTLDSGKVEYWKSNSYRRPEIIDQWKNMSWKNGEVDEMYEITFSNYLFSKIRSFQWYTRYFK